MSYVFWNNKGGVGKSTLTFQLATTYARNHPEKEVYIVDLSPQCDVSRMVLGGGMYKGEEKILELMESKPRKTILQYLSDCSNEVPINGRWPDPNNYTIKSNEVRDNKAPNLPENLNLVCGDFDLELTLQTLSNLAQPLPRAGRVPTGPHYSIFLLIRSFVRQLSLTLENQWEGCVFIDTDPYYDVLSTHMGLLAADNWITLYSPGSQASQYAVYRSIEFLYNSKYGLKIKVESHKEKYTTPWYDNRGNEFFAPEINVPEFYMLLSNMTRPYSGNKPYSRPQQLHRVTIKDVESKVLELGHSPIYNDFIWNLQRIGLICDYNGVGIHDVKHQSSYPQPDQKQKYAVNSKQQLNAYQEKINEIAGYL